MEKRVVQMPSRVLFGLGAVENAGEELKGLQAKKALLVTDKIMVKVGMVDKVTGNLDNHGIEHTIYDRVSSEPTLDFIEEGVKLFKDNQCDSVIAVGGGSPIDAAKAIAVMAKNSGSIADYKGLGKLPLPGVPLICVPTTAGTGSEATQFTIITDPVKDEKMLIGSPHLMPDIAVVDPELTLTMPRGLTAATGIDSLTHAIEAYVSVKAQPMSDMYALSAVELIAGNLRQAWANSNNLEARAKTMLGALYGGIAFSNSSVALVHGMSRPIGANFHVAHGDSNAALLDVVMEFSLIGNPSRYARLAEVVGETVEGLNTLEKAEAGVAAVKRLVRDVKVPSLKELGVEKDKLKELLPKMADEAIASGSPGNNPRQATRDEIMDLYMAAYKGGK